MCKKENSSEYMIFCIDFIFNEIDTWNQILIIGIALNKHFLSIGDVFAKNMGVAEISTYIHNGLYKYNLTTNMCLNSDCTIAVVQSICSSLFLWIKFRTCFYKPSGGQISNLHFKCLRRFGKSNFGPSELLVTKLFRHGCRWMGFYKPFGGQFSNLHFKCFRNLGTSNFDLLNYLSPIFSQMDVDGWGFYKPSKGQISKVFGHRWG